MSKHIHHIIEQLIAKGVEFQIGLRGSPQTVGPGKVERVEIDLAEAERVAGAPSVLVFYRMLVPAAMQADKTSRPKNVFLPVLFDAEDVQLVIEAPLNREGEPAIITPNGGRSAGGLHIPGGS